MADLKLASEHGYIASVSEAAVFQSLQLDKIAKGKDIA